MVSHVPVIRENGAGRVHLEIGEELRRRGHEVEIFDSREAYRESKEPKRLLAVEFSKVASHYVRRNGQRFDVIDAHHGCLPHSKKRLGISCLLVARSSGLQPLFREYAAYERRRWPGQREGSVAGHVLQRYGIWRRTEQCRRSLVSADLGIVLTEEELALVEREVAPGTPCVVIPNGLEKRHRNALQNAARSSEERLASREVVFIGRWCLAKGAGDWAEIVRRVRARIPGARFRFLGTGRTDLGGIGGKGIVVVPEFLPGELPRLVADAAVGVLPTYVEGWGLGLLELLAAGVPCVAYGVSGPRAILSGLDESLLVGRGDAVALSEKIVSLLRSTVESYHALSRRAVQRAKCFEWDRIVSETEAAYLTGINAVDPNG